MQTLPAGPPAAHRRRDPAAHQGEDSAGADKPPRAARRKARQDRGRSVTNDLRPIKTSFPPVNSRRRHAFRGRDAIFQIIPDYRAARGEKNAPAGLSRPVGRRRSSVTAARPRGFTHCHDLGHQIFLLYRLRIVLYCITISYQCSNTIR